MFYIILLISIILTISIIDSFDFKENFTNNCPNPKIMYETKKNTDSTISLNSYSVCVPEIQTNNDTDNRENLNSNKFNVIISNNEGGVQESNITKDELNTLSGSTININSKFNNLTSSLNTINTINNNNLNAIISKIEETDDYNKNLTDAIGNTFTDVYKEVNDLKEYNTQLTSAVGDELTKINNDINYIKEYNNTLTTAVMDSFNYLNNLYNNTT